MAVGARLWVCVRACVRMCVCVVQCSVALCSVVVVAMPVRTQITNEMAT